MKRSFHSEMILAVPSVTEVKKMQQVEIEFLHFLGTLLPFLHHLNVVILCCLTAPSGPEYNISDSAISRAGCAATI